MTAFPSYAFPVLDAGAIDRTMPARLSEILNVKDFGALGNGLADDTAAIQLVFDLAYGTTTSPHGDTNKYLNRTVFIPNGNYLLTQPTALTISGAANNGSGKFRLTVTANPTTGYAVGQMILVAGVTGTFGSSPNGYFGITALTSTTIDITAPYTSGTYTSGGTITRNPLQLRSVRGFKILGAGRGSTILRANTTNGGVIACNGMDYGIFEGIGFCANGNGVAFDFNWDGTGPVALQATTFNGCDFGGTAKGSGIGCQIGLGGYQASELTFLNCHHTGLGAGGYVSNFNALQIQYLGGQCQSCTIGIHVASGGVPVISNMGFQVNDQDIQVDGGTFADVMTIQSCRSESANFFKGNFGGTATLIDCGQTQGTAGSFATFNGTLTMIACYSTAGTIDCPNGNAANLFGFGNTFGASANAVINWTNLHGANISRALTQGFDGYYWLTDSSGNMANGTFSRLPAASAVTLGTVIPVYDSTTATVDATITGGGTNKVLAYSTNTAWKVLKAL